MFSVFKIRAARRFFDKNARGAAYGRAEMEAPKQAHMCMGKRREIA